MTPNAVRLPQARSWPLAAGRVTLLDGLLVADRLRRPLLGALAAFGRRVNRHLQERVMAAVGGLSSIAH